MDWKLVLSMFTFAAVMAGSTDQVRDPDTMRASLDAGSKSPGPSP